MGKKCSLKNCSNYYHEYSSFTFHELPRNMDNKKRWLDAIPKGLLRENVKNIIICSAHFSHDNYQPLSLGLTKGMLRKSATPNLFDCYKPNKTKNGKNKKKRKETVDAEVQTTTWERTKDNGNQTSKKWFINTERENELLKKIRALQRRLHRRKAKISSMESLVEENLKTRGFCKEDWEQILWNNFGKVEL